MEAKVMAPTETSPSSLSTSLRSSFLLAAGVIVGFSATAPASARSCRTSPTGGGYSTMTCDDGTTYRTSPTGGGYSTTTGSDGTTYRTSPTGGGYSSTTGSDGT